MPQPPAYQASLGTLVIAAWFNGRNRQPAGAVLIQVLVLYFNLVLFVGTLLRKPVGVRSVFGVFFLVDAEGAKLLASTFMSSLIIGRLGFPLRVSLWFVYLRNALKNKRLSD